MIFNDEILETRNEVALVDVYLSKVRYLIKCGNSSNRKTQIPRILHYLEATRTHIDSAIEEIKKIGE